MGKERRTVRLLEEGRKWRLPGLLQADDLVLCGESEEDLRTMVERFAKACRRGGLKLNEGKSMVMVLNREEGLESEVYVDAIRLVYVSVFEYMECVLDEPGTGEW